MAKRTKEQELIIENDILHHMLEKQYADFLSDDEEIENSDNLNAVRTKAKRNLKSPVKVGKNLVEQNTNRINMTEPYDDIEERATKNIKHEVSEYIDKAKYDGEDKNNINLKNVNKKNEVQNKKIRTISRVKLNIDDIVKPKVIDNSINTSKVEEIDEKVSGADNKATKISKNEIIQNEIPAVEEKIEIAEKVNIQSEEKKKAKSKKATKNKILEISKLDEKVVDKFSNDEEINKKLVKDEDTENIELITKIKNIDEINILEDNTKKSKKVKKTNKKEITKNENLVNENEIVVKKKAKKSSQKEALEQENEILEKNKIKKATKNKKKKIEDESIIEEQDSKNKVVSSQKNDTEKSNLKDNKNIIENKIIDNENQEDKLINKNPKNAKIKKKKSLKEIIEDAGLVTKKENIDEFKSDSENVKIEKRTKKSVKEKNKKAKIQQIENNEELEDLDIYKMDLPDFDEKEESLLEDIIDEDNSYSKAEEIDLNSDFILKQFEEDNNSLDNEIENANSIQNIDTKKATSIKKKNKNKVEDNDKHLERLRRRIVKEMKDYVRPVKGQVKIKADHKNELFDIAVPLNKFCVVLEKDEYKIYTDNSNSYIIADQPNLRIMYRKLYVYIEKYNGVYFVVTNQDIQFCEKVSGMSKAKDIVSFYAKSLKELELENDVLNITCKEIEDEELIQSNDTLLISEEENKVYLPYTADELKEDTRIFNDLSVSEIIQKKYVHSLKLYKNSMRARFREGFELMHNREEKSFKESVMLGIELMFEFNLHPAIISACRTLEELDIYLDCLDDNELEKFSCFKIIYKAMPVIAKNNNKVQVS